MTAVLLKNRKLLTDSFVEKGGEWLEMSDKVMIVKREMKLVSHDGLFEDHILGMAYAGARYPAMAFCNAIHRATLDMLNDIVRLTANPPEPLEPDTMRYSYEAVVREYAHALRLGLINQENHFVCILIGAKGNYFVESNEEAGLIIERISEDIVQMLGSGARYMKDFDKRQSSKAEPIRMMHHAILMEPGCGGQIYQYEVVDDVRHESGKALALTGIYYEPDSTLLQVCEVAADIPLAPDMIVNPKGYTANRWKGAPAGISVDPDSWTPPEEKPAEIDPELQAVIDRQARIAAEAKAKQDKPVRKPAPFVKRKPTTRKKKP